MKAQRKKGLTSSGTSWNLETISCRVSQMHALIVVKYRTT